MKPKNIILYGPPGTGKTYHVINKCLEILDPTLPSDLLENPSRRAEAVRLFHKYVENNQVKFCTFHQSYSYEEFVEGIRFVEEGQGFEIRDGIFKEICAAAQTTISDRKTVYDFNPDDINFFKMSLGNVKENNDDIYHYCIENNVIALGWGGDVDYTNCPNKQAIQDAYRAKYPQGESFGIEAVERFKHWMKQGDIVIISYGNTQVRAIGKIVGDYTFNPDTSIDYNHFRAVEWLYKDVKIPVQKILREKVFSQQTIYMFYKKDINMDALKELLSSSDHTRQNNPQYVLVIDEINRGNISKIFGELITLIEPDKRIGSMNETWVTLPYSGERFGIPNNVHILGTMNTADRSIALLDTALRRRFDFIEMMPDYDLLPEDVEGINVRKMLQVMNDRIEYLYDRDHVIGHAYFLAENPTVTFYLQVMLKKVIPLLQEYFYENWEYIELVLGGAGKVGDPSYFLHKSVMQSDKLFSGNARIPEQQKTRYLVNPNPSPDALRNIYKHVGKEIEE
jgi:5-methylcytosine-specific restriction protein B